MHDNGESTEGQPRRPGRPPMQGETFVKLRANIPPAQANRLAAIAAARGVSLSELVRGIFAEWLEREGQGDELR